MKRRFLLPLLGIGLAAPGVAAAEPALAEPAPAKTSAAPAPTGTGDLQSPEQRDRRNAAYSLPAHMWSFDVSGLGLGGGEAFAKLGVAYGFGAGFEIDMNLAHVGVGVLNLAGRFQFLDTRYLDLGVTLGVWYGKGEWVWIANESATRLISELDLLYVPLGLAASMPFASWVQADLGVWYTYADVFGTLIDRESLFLTTQLGMRQFDLRPGVRFFVSDRVELDVFSSLPVYSAIPVSVESANGERSHEFEGVPFSDVWSIETSVRSRFATGVFGSVRLHYSKLARALYGAPLYPSFELEFRL